MPELPEVETTRLGLIPALVGIKIARVQVFRRDLRQPIPADFEQLLEGKSVQAIRRRAKYLLLDMPENLSVLAHLGMSGTFQTVTPARYNLRTHDHVVLTLADGSGVVFHDPRRFGLLLPYIRSEEARHPLLEHLGPEPLSSDFTPAYLAHALARRKGAIKPVLMQQELVVGVGNIYASESLFRAKIHPDTPALKAAKHAEILVKSIQETLRDALESGGSTLRDYVRSSGDSGYFQHQFRVYERAGEACFVCGTTIEHSVHAGRSTYQCPQCQPLRAYRKKT
jgi:formamidopyrimidine-DNA glycosylase